MKILLVSQTKLSQYMNRSYRTKGWKVLEERLLQWVKKNIADRGILPATEAADLLPSPPDVTENPQVYSQYSSLSPDNRQYYYEPICEQQRLHNDVQRNYCDGYAYLTNGGLGDQEVNIIHSYNYPTYCNNNSYY